MNEDYIQKNRETWNAKTEHHVNSAFYDNKSFIEGKSSLNDIELAYLGNVAGKSILHLQCHFGQDSLSLARMGANVTGVDFSDKAIEAAVKLNFELGLNAKFICSDVYKVPDILKSTFDIVFTSYGTIGWLPDLNKWGAVVAQYIKPGGKFIIAEFHPVVWMFDNDFKRIQYSYFKGEPIVEIENGTYADKAANLTTETITWNHGIAEVMNSLLAQNLTISRFDEYNYSPYTCFNNLVEVAPGRYMIKGMEEKLPMVYSLEAVKSTA